MTSASLALAGIAGQTQTRWRCSGCYCVGPSLPSAEICNAREVAGVGFASLTCRACGHRMVATEGKPLRDLTRAEAARVAASPKFERWMKETACMIAHLWG